MTSIIQGNHDLKKILVAPRIFLKSIFFLIPNIRNTFKKLLISHRFAKRTFERKKCHISNDFDFIF